MTGYDGPDASEQMAIDMVIERANAHIDWKALEKELGDLSIYKIAFNIVDTTTLCGFVVKNSKLEKLVHQDDLKGTTHIVSINKPTFWSVAEKKITIDEAYFTFSTVNVQGENPHMAARVLKRIWDFVWEVL